MLLGKIQTRRSAETFDNEALYTQILSLAKYRTLTFWAGILKMYLFFVMWIAQLKIWKWCLLFFYYWIYLLSFFSEQRKHQIMNTFFESLSGTAGCLKEWDHKLEIKPLWCRNVMWSLMGIWQGIFCWLLASCQGDSQDACSRIKCSVNKLGSLKVICMVLLTGALGSGFAVQSEISALMCVLSLLALHVSPSSARHFSVQVCTGYLLAKAQISSSCIPCNTEFGLPLCKRETEMLCLRDSSCITK